MKESDVLKGYGSRFDNLTGDELPYFMEIPYDIGKVPYPRDAVRNFIEGDDEDATADLCAALAEWEKTK